MTIPTTIHAGDSFAAVEQPASHLATDGWTLHLRLAALTPGNTTVTLDSVADGPAHRYAVASEITAAWAPDRYSWMQWATRGGERQTLDSGSMEIKPDPVTMAEGYDTRSAAAIALADARQAFYSFDPTRKRYKIGGREMEFATAADILVKIRQLEREVEREEQLAGKARRVPRRIYTRI